MHKVAVAISWTEIQMEVSLAVAPLVQLFLFRAMHCHCQNLSPDLESRQSSHYGSRAQAIAIQTGTGAHQPIIILPDAQVLSVLADLSAWACIFLLQHARTHTVTLLQWRKKDGGA